MNRTFVKTISLTLILFSFFAMGTSGQSPVKDYAKEWKKVEDFTKKQLPKSALEEVTKIYALAKKDKQDAQVIKALVYMTTLQAENREDNELFSIVEIEKEIATSLPAGQAGKEPVSSILKSLLAEMYYNYYQEHRWQLYNRTKTAQFNNCLLYTSDAADE